MRKLITLACQYIFDGFVIFSLIFLLGGLGELNSLIAGLLGIFIGLVIMYKNYPDES